MIHLERQVVNATLEDLQFYLQKAIELEHATIPPYLTAYYSLHGNSHEDIRQALREVAIEEMLHMGLAANILNAVGGTPNLYSPEFIPSYPSPLPLGIGSGQPDKQFIVPLEAFSKQLLKNVFMAIEEPEHPRSFPVAEARMTEADLSFATIGEFYEVLKTIITELGEEIFVGQPDKQVNLHQSFAGIVKEERVPATVTNLEEALRAIDVIVEQGEGTEISPLDQNSMMEEDYAHYYKFAAIFHGRKLKADPTKTEGFSYTGTRIAYNPEEVYPMIANLKLSDLNKSSDEHQKLKEFNQFYTLMLQQLHQAFNGQPEQMRQAIQTMRGDFNTAAKNLVKTRIQPDSFVRVQLGELDQYHMAPSFEFVEGGATEKTRFDRVKEILDDSISNQGSIGYHGTFWRDVSRNQFISKGYGYRGLDFITLNNGADSNLVKALKGESPFGADLDNPPAGASYNRMPSGYEPVSDENIQFIEKWIDDGCPEDPFEDENEMVWRPTNAPIASSRTDDIWFNNPDTGWAVNSNGEIVHTKDGGQTWTVQLHMPGVYFRSIGFADDLNGWAGTLTGSNRLFHTTDGGENWNEVSNLPDLAPSAICGISVVSKDVVWASGTNYPNRPARVIRTTDGGESWDAIDMSAWANILVDCKFADENRGWVVGGKLIAAAQTRDNVRPVVLYTEDGGQTWEDRLSSISDTLKQGEWGWKIQFVNEQVVFASLEAFDFGAILKSLDGGQTWERLPINDPQQNANLEGVGFIDENRGWVGGWGDREFERQSSSETTDGGQTWQDANQIGRAINRFRFFGSPVTVGYSSGVTVYKYAAKSSFQAVPELMRQTTQIIANKFMGGSANDNQIVIPIRESNEGLAITLRIWDRFGEQVAEITPPTDHGDSIEWDLKNFDNKKVSAGQYIVRVTRGESSESSILKVE